MNYQHAIPRMRTESTDEYTYQSSQQGNINLAQRHAGKDITNIINLDITTRLAMMKRLQHNRYSSSILFNKSFQDYTTQQQQQQQQQYQQQNCQQQLPIQMQSQIPYSIAPSYILKEQKDQCPVAIEQALKTETNIFDNILQINYNNNSSKNSFDSNQENIPPNYIMKTNEQIFEEESPTDAYIENIMQHLRDTEASLCPKGNYLGTVQNDISEKMRGILFDWLVDVHQKFKLLPETLFLTLNLIDRFLEKEQINRSQLQLVGVASLFISCKYEEVYSVPHVKDLVYVCDKAYSKEEILQMEGNILETLQFNLVTASSLRFLEHYSKTACFDEKNYMMCRYLIEIALLDYSMLKYKPSIITCAAIYLVNKIRKRFPAWSEETMVKGTQLNEIQVRPCAKELCTLLQTIDKRSNFKSLKRKFSQECYLEVSNIRIERKKQQ